MRIPNLALFFLVGQETKVYRIEKFGIRPSFNSRALFESTRLVPEFREISVAQLVFIFAGSIQHYLWANYVSQSVHKEHYDFTCCSMLHLWSAVTERTHSVSDILRPHRNHWNDVESITVFFNSSCGGSRLKTIKLTLSWHVIATNLFFSLLKSKLVI